MMSTANAKYLLRPRTSIIAFVLACCWHTALSQPPEVSTKQHKLSSIEFKPHAIHLENVPTKPECRTVVLRSNGTKPIRIQSVVASDRLLGVSVAENPNTRISVVTVSLPEGYKTPSSQPAMITITTDMKDSREVKIPLTVSQRKDVKDTSWIKPASELIGKKAPEVVVKTLRGDLTLGKPDGQFTVIMFWAPWCEHCSKRLPAFFRICDAYKPKGVNCVAVAALAHDRTIDDVAGRNHLNPSYVASDLGMLAARQYRVVAYPVIFVVNRAGVIEAVHGRISNLSVQDGLEGFEKELRAELDLLLAGKPRTAYVSDISASQPSG